LGPIPSPKALAYRSYGRRANCSSLELDASAYELLELSTGAVTDVLCNLRPPAAPASIEYREPTGSEPPGRLNRGGRAAKFQWDDIWFRVMRYLHEKGLPEHQAEMVVAIQELCRDADLGEPDESTLKPKVRRLFKIWHEAEKGHN